MPISSTKMREKYWEVGRWVFGGAKEGFHAKKKQLDISIANENLPNINEHIWDLKPQDWDY
jgi:hypothetical protein